MIYRDYSRAEGEWIPNQYGGRENLEAIEFLKHTNGKFTVKWREQFLLRKNLPLLLA